MAEWQIFSCAGYIRLDIYEIKQGGDILEHFGCNQVEYWEYRYHDQNIDRIVKVVQELFFPLIHCLLSCLEARADYGMIPA